MVTAVESQPQPARKRPGWWRRQRGSLLGALGAVVVLAVVLYVRLVSPVGVRAHVVERGEVVAQVFGRGTIESDREAQLGFDLVGRLSEVLVDEGARVSLGQELARLYSDQVSADLQSATTGVAAARASLTRLAAEERRARAGLEAAEREERRIGALAAGGVVAQREADIAQDGLRLARAEMDRVLAQRSEASRSIDVAQGGVAQRRVTVLRATLLAPFDGLVTRRLREPGDTVAVGTTVLRVVDTEQVFVSAWIDESVLGEVQEGQVARVVLPGPGRSTSAVVHRVGWESDRQTHELLVDVRPSEPLGRITMGRRADVWIATQTRAEVVRVPAEFLQRDAEGTFCNVDRNGRIARARVKMGLIGRDVVEIVEGLEAGDTVLAALTPGGVLPGGRRWARP